MFVFETLPTFPSSTNQGVPAGSLLLGNHPCFSFLSTDFCTFFSQPGDARTPHALRLVPMMVPPTDRFPALNLPPNGLAARSHRVFWCCLRFFLSTIMPELSPLFVLNSASPLVGLISFAHLAIWKRGADSYVEPLVDFGIFLFYSHLRPLMTPFPLLICVCFIPAVGFVCPLFFPKNLFSLCSLLPPIPQFFGIGRQTFHPLSEVNPIDLRVPQGATLPPFGICSDFFGWPSTLPHP